MATEPRHSPQFPLYIPSKGRADTRLTAQTLARMRVPYRIVIEEQEWSAYAAVESARNLLVLERRYQRDYETCDDVGDAKGKGPGPARNFIWEHAISEGHAWHWVMDDNIRHFYRMHKNRRIVTNSGAIFRAMEDFCLRYLNVAMAGPAYSMFGFCEHMERLPPFIINTRIYSCNLIRNDVPHRWRGRYNEDTILSLDMLKAGWCTVQFNAFLQGKINTQQMGGGNTAEFYAREGTTAKSRMQVAVHPDCSRMVWKFGRVHHHVDYKRFKQRLVRRPGLELPSERDEYGMQLAQRKR